MPSPAHHPRDPLHGVTLERILNELVAQHGWAEMGERIPIQDIDIAFRKVRPELQVLKPTA
jgi:uncharacterized protein (DUF2132 family)